MGDHETIYGDNMLSVAHIGNRRCKIPLAPVIITASRTPDVAKDIIASHACCSVY